MPSLRALLSLLDPAVRVLNETAAAGAGQGLDIEVADVVLVGPGDPLPAMRGCLLLCLNASADLVSQAAASGAAAVAIKLHDGDPEAWSHSALPVVVFEDTQPWHHVLQLLTTALSSATARSGSPEIVAGDLFGLANSIAVMVGGATAIEDPQRRVIAYSSVPDQPIDETRRQGILGRQVPDRSDNEKLYRRLADANAPMHLSPEESGNRLGRLAMVVKSGSVYLGSIWVVEETPLGPEAEQNLEAAARLASLHLLRARAGSELERRARGELLRALLDGRSSTGTTLARMGVDLSKPAVVIGFLLPEETAHDDITAEAVADLVQLQCSALRARSSVLVHLGTVYAMVPAEGVTRKRLAQMVNGVVQRAQVALGVSLIGAIGTTVASPFDVIRSRDEVDAVLRVQEPGSVAAVEDVLPQVVLLTVRGALAKSDNLRLPAVEAMVEHDAEHGTIYAESVLAYLEASGDVAIAAARVNIHANTFRYRMRRLRELFDIDLEDADTRLVVWLQLRTRP